MTIHTAPVDATPPDATAPERPARLLVVDDVADNREILTRRLVRRGFEVVEASGGQEALALLEEQEFDLILLDIMMPDLAGTEVVRIVRASHSAEDLPIIMVSAMSESQDVSASLELGANDYVTKPVDFPVALARIRAQLERRRAALAKGRSLRMAAEQLRAEADGRRRSEEQLRYLAYFDALTGVSNRVAFRERLEEVLADPAMAAKEPTVILIDLDRFKAINDAHGHQTGDLVLRAVGERLGRCLPDALAVGRLGGDEFAALLIEDGDAEIGRRCAEGVIDALCRPFVIGDQQFQIGASCGVARASQCGHRMDLLMQAADLAMYRAKLSGRACAVLFEPHILEEQLERSALEVDMRRAISLDQLEVHYQPLVRSDTRQLSCFEALVRWRHPVRGLVPPDVFIPIAEETGTIHELGAWVLGQACAEAAAWPAGINVAVNLSPLQFRHPDLLSVIAGTLARAGLPAHRLELEITESGLLEAGDHNAQIIHAIRQLGVRVVLDDFGAGYSTMSYLQNFVFDKLKIDRRFVKDMNDDASSAAIVKAIARLGADIGIETAAEGIETEEQFSAVLGSGCSEVQGYLFSRPLPVDLARKLIAELQHEPQGAFMVQPIPEPSR